MSNVYYRVCTNDYSTQYWLLRHYIIDILSENNVYDINNIFNNCINVWYPRPPILHETVWWADIIDKIREPTIEYSDKILDMILSYDVHTQKLGFDLLKKVSTKKYYNQIIYILSKI